MKPSILVALVTNNDAVIGNTAVAFSHLPDHYTLKTCRTLDNAHDLKHDEEPDFVLFDWAMLPKLTGIPPTALAQFEHMVWLIPPQTAAFKLPITHPHLTYDQLDARHLRPLLPPPSEPLPSYDILRQIFDEIPHPILLWRQTDNQDFVLEQANRAADNLGRGAMAQYLGNTAVEFFRGNQAILKRLQTTFETGQHQQFSNHFRVENTRETKWLVAHYVKINATHLLYLLQDITNERQSVLDAAYSEARLRSIWDYVSDALVLSDAHGRVIDANQAYFDLYGYTKEEVVDRDFAIIFPEEQRAVARAQYQQTFRAPQPPQAIESMIELATGEQRFVETSIAFITNEVGERLALLSSVRDITKRKQAQQALLQVQGRLVQSEKLAIIGELLASVAHELNNPVTTLVLNAELLQQYNQPGDNPLFDRLLTNIISQAQRSSKIVHNLLDFARQRPPERAETQLNELVLATIELLVYELRTRNIRLETALSPDLPMVVVDAQQIQQVLVNLLNNAIQALEGYMPKLIAISTQFAHGRVQIAITDNGPGIPLDRQQQIFNSFFTTKEPGFGTGLGLSIGHNIVAEHQGKLWVESNPEIKPGSTFWLELPLTQTPPETNGTPQPAQRQSDNPTSETSGRILIVDDEPTILEAFQIVLVNYKVETVTSATAALEKLHQNTYDLIISDIYMPGMSGIDFYNQLCEQQPSLAQRVLFVTGDTLTAYVHQFLERMGLPVLHKPFSMAALHTAVENILG